MTHDETLARLIREAADQVQPQPALDAIRARTAPSRKESPMSIARTWILGGLGGAVATAAVIGGVYFVTTSGDDGPVVPGPAGTASQSPSQSPSQSVEPTPTPTSGGTATATPEPTTTVAVPVYWVGETPYGDLLYREFQKHDVVTADGANGKVAAAVDAAVQGTPADPDYRSPWPAGVAASVPASTGTPDVITVDLTGDVHDRPSGMSAKEADLAIQQLVYTAQAAYGQGRLPVQLLLEGKHSDTVLGVPTSEPLANAPVLDTLSLVNLSTPSEGDVVTGDTLEVSGVSNSFEATTVLRLQRYEGTYIAFQGSATANGWMDDKLFPFSTSIDISSVAPGKYVLMAMTDDPSGGTEGNGPYSDSKVITIK